MQTNIASSIQEYCKKINRQITFFHMVSLLVTLVCFIVLTVYVVWKQEMSRTNVIYRTTQESKSTYSMAEKNNSLPFGSKSGTTYTFSWCSGSTRISQKNKVYFSSEQEAQSSGRRLSKLCQK